MNYYAINIFTNERTPAFYTEEEMDSFLDSYDADAQEVRFDVYHNGQLAYYAWNKAYYEKHIKPRFLNFNRAD